MNDGLTNANTIAQIVAFLYDRFRQRNSDSNEAALPPLPAPRRPSANGRIFTRVALFKSARYDVVLSSSHIVRSESYSYD